MDLAMYGYQKKINFKNYKLYGLPCLYPVPILSFKHTNKIKSKPLGDSLRLSCSNIKTPFGIGMGAVFSSQDMSDQSLTFPANLL